MSCRARYLPLQVALAALACLLPQPAAAAPGDQRPQVKVQAPATFPKRAFIARWESTRPHNVRVAVTVDAEGKPVKAVVREGVGGNFGFNEAAVEAALKSTFDPGRADSRPQGGEVELLYVFAPIAPSSRRR